MNKNCQIPAFLLHFNQIALFFNRNIRVMQDKTIDK